MGAQAAAGCAALGVAFAGLALACASGSTDGSRVAGGVDQQMVGLYPTGRLMLAAPPGTVLVSRAGEPFITVGEFNERSREFPIGDVGQPVPAARKQVLDQLIDHKLLALEALPSRGRSTVLRREGEDPYALERARADGVIKTAVANPFLVSDEEARRFLSEHRERFEGLDTTGIPAPEALLVVKFSMLSDRMQEQLKARRLTERIETFQQLLGDD